MDVHVYLHNTDDKLVKKVNKLMATINDLKAAVERNTSVDDSVLTMLTGLVQQLKDAQANNDPAAIDQLIAQLDANTQKMTDAVTANTPAEEPSEPSQPV